MSPTAVYASTLLFRNAKVVRAAWMQASRIIKNHFSATTRPAQVNLPVRRAAQHSIPRFAVVRQGRSRWHSINKSVNVLIRQFATAAQHAPKINRAPSFSETHVGGKLRISRCVPFATTLRPNLTGGVLGRMASGHGIGGSVRYFSQSPTAPAQVINNVSQAVRAFILSGKRAQYNGVNLQTKEKRYRLVTPLQTHLNDGLHRVPQAIPGSFIDFFVNPTITALTPLNSMSDLISFSDKESIRADGLLNGLAADFSRSQTELSAVLSDIKRLATLGDLSITYRMDSLRIHFPGCDGDTVARLCDDLGISRGIITQDQAFDTFAGTGIALLFPYAPSRTPSDYSLSEKAAGQKGTKSGQIDWRDMISAPVSKHSSRLSGQSGAGYDFEDIIFSSSSSGLRFRSDCESLHSSEFDELGL